jgi:hypothetical protein
MIKKIISGGQTGADQAGLDVAVELNIPHGGWIPKGRNPSTGEDMILAPRRVVTFRCSRKLRAKINR